MALQKNKLTDRTVRAIERPGYHADGDGLYLQVTAARSKSWIFRYSFDGSRPEIGLGSFRDVSLAEARRARDLRQAVLAKGLDPRSIAAADAASVPQVRSAALPASSDPPAGGSSPSLLSCWLDYVAAQEAGWRGRKTKASWIRSIEKHAEAIKDRPVDAIDVDAVIEVLRPIWMTKAESAGKLRDRLERVLDYAKVRGDRAGANPAVWKGNLVHLLPPRPKLQRGHMAALPYADVPDLMVRLSRRAGMSARALEFTILTVARETMTLEATWREMTGDLWSLSQARMKERPFQQPLSTGAMGVLDRVRPRTPRPHDLVFPALSGAALSDMAMDMMLRELAPGFTPHGMRSSFRDWAGDETEFPREIAEGCLAHLIGDETERAYRRGDALRKRRDLLEAWSDYCLSAL